MTAEETDMQIDYRFSELLLTGGLVALEVLEFGSIRIYISSDHFLTSPPAC